MAEWAELGEFREICAMVDPSVQVGRARGFAIPQKWEEFLEGGWKDFKDGDKCDGACGRPLLMAADMGALWDEAGSLVKSLAAQSAARRGAVMSVSWFCFFGYFSAGLCVCSLNGLVCCFRYVCGEWSEAGS